MKKTEWYNLALFIYATIIVALLLSVAISVANLNQLLTSIESKQLIQSNEDIATDSNRFVKDEMERNQEFIELLFPRQDFIKYKLVERTGKIKFYYDPECTLVIDGNLTFWSTNVESIYLPNGLTKVYVVMLEDHTLAYCHGDQLPTIWPGQ